ncbi:MAG: tRNA (adenosine(37)-N6)-threonylcarbamoyltransferase complex dimerization subunit type 1 TsaB [Verrucomicrobiota bacterium]
MKILALEFSSPQRSVAVLNADARGGVLATSEIVEAAAGNTMKPFSMIEAVLQQTGLEREQIECLVVGLGPGSYNGVRAAIALAQGWQLAAGVKLLGVSSAECVAAQALADGAQGKFSVVIDAQREEFYVADYEVNAGKLNNLSPLGLVAREDVCRREQAGSLLIGPEVARWFPNGRVVFPRAEMLGRLALGRNDFASGEKLEPIYLRLANFVKAPPPRVFCNQ